MIETRNEEAAALRPCHKKTTGSPASWSPIIFGKPTTDSDLNFETTIHISYPITTMAASSSTATIASENESAPLTPSRQSPSQSASTLASSSSTLADYLITGQYGDIAILCRDDAFHAHKVILAGSGSEKIKAHCERALRDCQGINGFPLIDLSNEEPAIVARVFQ